MKKRKSKKKEANTSNIILIVLGVFLFSFIVTMIVTFWVKGAVPDTLIQYVLGAGGIEAVVLGFIKVSKIIKDMKMGKEINDEQFH